MAGLLIGGSIAAIDKLKAKREGKRRSTATSSISQDVPSSPSTVEPSSPRTPTHDVPVLPPPSFSQSNLHEDVGRPSTAAEEKERMRQEDAAAALAEGQTHPAYRQSVDEEVPAYEHVVPEHEGTAPPTYEAPPYSRHRSDTLLESSRPRRGRQQRTQSHGLFPSMVHSSPVENNMDEDMTFAESSAEAAQMERMGRKKCIVGPDGRCACGKRERSPNAPLGETVKERRERKWKERFDFGSPGFWGLVGISLASHGGTGRWYDDSKQFRYWKD